MSTDVDAPAARRSRLGWLAALLVVALGALFGLHRCGLIGADQPAGSAGLAGFQAQLSAKVVNVLERLPAKGHGHAGHAAVPGASTLVCGVRVFGFDPDDADALAQVTQVYGYHMCAVAEVGLDWTFAVKLTGPLVVKLNTDPPTVTVAESGDGFRDRVRALIPAKYQAEAFNENLTVEGMKELIRRYAEVTKA